MEVERTRSSYNDTKFDNNQESSEENTQTAYAAINTLMRRILEADVQVSGRGRTLQEDNQYFKSRGVEGVLDLPPEQMAAIDPHYMVPVFGPPTVQRLKSEFMDYILNLAFPWTGITEDMVANFRCGVNPHDTNLIAWKFVVTKTMKALSKDIFSNRVELLCQKMKVFLEELVEVSIEIMGKQPEDVYRRNGNFLKTHPEIVNYLQSRISVAVGDSIEKVRTLTNDLITAVVCSNASWSEVSNPEGLKEPSTLHVNGESLMWVRSSTAFLWRSFIVQLKTAVDAMFKTLFIDRIFNQLALYKV